MSFINLLFYVLLFILFTIYFTSFFIYVHKLYANLLKTLFYVHKNSVILDRTVIVIFFSTLRILVGKTNTTQS